jgi:hypothetical protein
LKILLGSAIDHIHHTWLAAYFAKAVSYARKKFMKLATDRTQRRPEEEEKRSPPW